MVTLLITSVLILGLIAIGIYLWQKPANTSESLEALPSPPQPSGLFSDNAQNQLASMTENSLQSHETLLESAQNADKTALDEARESNDSALYDQVLNILVAQADSEAKLLSLVSHVTRNEFPVNKALAQKSIDCWQKNLDRQSTAKMLHIAALSDDAETYRKAVEIVLSSWREGKLPELSATELQSLLNGEFWILSSRTRSSGAGFVLKRTLSTANRELAPTNNP
ncbi:MAG TPA: hypothetical protein VJ875_26375 [Pyrinomonadaceae bacterium]|nr:hypothetical protein [Pyrinomonadaceae bacterium]